LSSGPLSSTKNVDGAAPTIISGDLPSKKSFPPLLDTSEIRKQLTPRELNSDYMEYATTDQILETQNKDTRQQTIQLYRVIKAY